MTAPSALVTTAPKIPLCSFCSLLSVSSISLCKEEQLLLLPSRYRPLLPEKTYRHDQKRSSVRVICLLLQRETVSQRPSDSSAVSWSRFGRGSGRNLSNETLSCWNCDKSFVVHPLLRSASVTLSSSNHPVGHWPLCVYTCTGFITKTRNDCLPGNLDQSPIDDQ